MVYSTVDLEPVVISSTPVITDSNSLIGIAGDQDVTIVCSVNITTNPLPEGVPLPSFEWFYGSTNTSLPSGVTDSARTHSDNTYTSTLQFSPLLVSHAGMYTCRLRDNERLAASIEVTVNGKASELCLLLKFISNLRMHS